MATVEEIQQKYLGDKSFSALSSEQQKRILEKNPNAERVAIKRARKYVGGYDKIFKASEEAKAQLSKLFHESTALLITLKKAGLNGTAAATQKIDDAIKSLRSTLDKESRLKFGQQGGPMDKIMEQQLKRDIGR